MAHKSYKGASIKAYLLLQGLTYGSRFGFICNMGLFIKTSIIFVPFTRSVEKHDKTLPLLDVADSASGNTPLMYATMANKIHLLESMISFGSQINVANKVKYGILLTTYLHSRNSDSDLDDTYT